MRAPEAKQPGPDPSVVVAEALLKRCREAGQRATLSGTHVTTSGREVGVKAKVENQSEKEGQHFVGLVVGVEIDGTPAPALQAGAVGVGGTREVALQVSANEWSQTIGTALLRVLAPATSPDTSVPYRLLPGAAGIRGKIKPEQLEALRPQLRQALEPFARSLAGKGDPKALHSLSVIVAANRATGVGGECRVDGKVSPELLAAIKKLPWPTATGYMFKRYYVVQAR